MSATTFGLPTSLTPDVLAQILRYEPRHWKAIAPRLVKECPDVWEHIHLSDDDFYTKLHTLLKDPLNRQTFEIATQKESTRNRSLTLCGAIHKYYSRSLRNDPSFADRLSKRSGPKETIDVLASLDDDDRLANVVWAFAENRKLTYADLSEIANNYPGVRMRLAGTVRNIGVAAPLEIQWSTCLSRMKGTLERAEKHGPDSKVVELLASYTNDLREIIRESENSAKIIASLMNLIDKYRHIFSDQNSLEPYIRMVYDGTPIGAFPQNAGDLVEKIDQNLNKLIRVITELRQTSLANANADQRIQLLTEMNELHGRETSIRDQVKRIFDELFHGIGIDGKPPATQTDITGSSNSERCDNLNDSKHSGPGHITENIEPPHEEDTIIPVSTCTNKDNPVDAEQNADQDSPEAINTNNGNLELPSHRTVPPKIDPASLDSTADGDLRRDTPSSDAAADILDAMLSSGRFARAYWLAYADQSLGDPRLMGALCEGARIGPGDSCPGVLIQFFEVLAEKDEWTDDERLLLCAAMIGPTRLLQKSEDPLLPRSSRKQVPGKSVIPAKAGIQGFS